MPNPDFVHLHVHSEYSLLDGANRISSLVKACQADEQRALALTDHGNMHGAVELYTNCKTGGIKPLVGCEVYVARRSMSEKHNKREGNGYSHLTLIARNEEGYRNLSRLTTSAFIDGFSFRPRIDMDLLGKHTAGISCLSGCLAGEINQLFGMNKEKQAEDLAIKLRDQFGPEHFWLELQRNGIEMQTKVNESLVRLHERTAIPLVATNDIHYLRHEDCAAQDVLLCINTGSKVADEKRFRFETDQLFFKTRAEMAHMFRDLPDAVKASMDVAEQVNFDFKFGTYHVPEFVPQDGEKANDLFDRLLEEALPRRYPGDHSAARERLKHEKEVIRELGFVSYFLIVWDLIRWARQHDIPVGPGRGSAAGSIVAYLLDITRLDPLRHKLLFERFLNSSRVSMPDIDIDFCKEGRERVIQYTRDRYGADCVTQIVTFGTLASRSVVRDVARVLDLPLGEVNILAKKIPSGPNAPNLKDALEADSELRVIRDQSPVWKDLFRYSLALEGLSRHASTHAAGVVITPGPTVDFVPLSRTGDDITTQYPAPQLEELGLLKMDYLGLRTLTIIDRCLRCLKHLGSEVPDIDNLPEGDPATYKMLMAGDTLGVFQLESEGMRKLLGRLKPDCFEDIVAVLALYRPGPLESGMADLFVDRKHGRIPILYPHESLEPILQDTYGCIVYQEQVMLAAVELGGFSLNDSDNLRKAMGKKKPEIMERFSAQFIEGAVANGCPLKTAQETWDNIVKFGGYGFNKSHSAAYAVITYQTAYLKANHLTAFLAANFSCEMGDSDKIKALLNECRKRKLEILPPSITHSQWEFIPEGPKAIRFGFGAIKGTGKKAIGELVKGRANLQEEGMPLDLHTMAEALDPQLVGKLCWEALIKAGSFDESGHNRGAVLATMEGALRDGAASAADRRSGQASLFGAPEPKEKEAETNDGIDDSRAVSPQEALAMEYEVLGYYLTGHPLEERAGICALLSSSPIPALADLDGGTEITIAGLVLQLTENTVRRGRSAGMKMARFLLEDLHGSIPVTVFPRTWAEMKDSVHDGDVLVLRAKIDDSREEPGLLLEEAWTLGAALAHFRGGLALDLNPKDMGTLPKLSELLGRYKGKSPVYLRVQGDDGVLRRVRTGREWSVHLSEDLARELLELLGAGRVGLARS
ncbi:MAG TPA: DNA polymerase III subunit alpha [Planctomycetes bacterium]|nr:DNA polymerase III subunit alpha [Planctomycetota bacterium]